MTARLTDREVFELGALFNAARPPLIRLADKLSALGESRAALPLGEERVALVLTRDEAKRALDALNH
jgi:hypothetical protein